MVEIFGQIPVSKEQAECIILGIPWDGTVSGRPGTRFGPRAIRTATIDIENYSPYLEKDISEVKIHDAGDISLPFGDTEKVLSFIRKTAANLIGTGRKIISLGGEHLVTLPLVEVMHKKYGNDLFIIQFDAHADLRDNYLGVKLSHATVMHHISQLIKPENIAVVGVRSGTKEEWNMLKSHPHFFGSTSPGSLKEFKTFAVETLNNKKIYLTIDLDVFDPSVLPGTGTPEPGGIFFPDFISLVRILKDFEIVGADIMELAPDYDSSGISNILASMVLRELLLIIS